MKHMFRPDPLILTGNTNLKYEISLLIVLAEIKKSVMTQCW